MKAHSTLVATLACCMVSAGFAAPAEQTIDATRLVAAARAALPASAPAANLAITVNVIGTPTDAIVPAGTVTLHAEEPPGRWPRSRVAVPVQIRVDGNLARSETVWFAVHAPRRGLVYDNDVPMGTPAVKLATRSSLVDEAATAGIPVAALNTLANERLRRGVHAGWPVLKSDFEPIPDVDKNTRVIVHVRYGAIQMQTVATALQAGDVGDAVPVLIEGAHSPVQARVEARGVVDIAR